jgi:hypothetical protein
VDLVKTVGRSPKKNLQIKLTFYRLFERCKFDQRTGALARNSPIIFKLSIINNQQPKLKDYY